MIEQLTAMATEALSNNQMLTAGIGTVVTGGLLALLKDVPYSFYNKIKRFFSIEITLTTRHECYDDVIKLLNSKRLPFLTRNFSLTFFATSSKGLIPGYGTSWGFYKGKIFHIHKDKLENKNEVEDQIIVSFLSRDKSLVASLIDESTQKEQFSKTIKVYSGMGTYYGSGHKEIPKRPMDTVFIDDFVKEKVVKRISDFYANEQWYLNRGIPYKLCIMLHGQPGTGKTSLIKALASKFDRNISYIDSFDKIDATVAESNTENFLVIEDFDAITNLRNREEVSIGPANDKDNLQKVLNVLDGMSTPHGCVFIMTTNYPEKIDPAVMRKGRVDESVEIPVASRGTMIKMYKAFYSVDLVDDEFLKYTPKTGAVLQDLFLTHGPKDVIQHLE